MVPSFFSNLLRLMRVNLTVTGHSVNTLLPDALSGIHGRFCYPANGGHLNCTGWGVCLTKIPLMGCGNQAGPPPIAMATSTEKFSLQTEQVAKSFGRRVICRDITLSLSVGQSVAIVGPNGSGKSTFVKMLAGLVRPDHGEIRHLCDGRPVSPERWFRNVGLVSPDLALYEELTARENLDFANSVGEWGRSGSDRDELLDELGLNGRGDDRVGTYSSGMRQRLKFVAALLKNPPLLLLDEPSITLDEDGATRIWASLARRSCALVIATNDPAEAARADSQVSMGLGQGQGKSRA